MTLKEIIGVVTNTLRNRTRLAGLIDVKEISPSVVRPVIAL